ncbi:unnamed protein product [Discula destructiva]
MASPEGDKWLDVSESPYTSSGANTAANGIFLGSICLSLVTCCVVAWRTRRFIPFTFVLCMAYVLEIWSYVLRFQGWNFSGYSIQYGLATVAPVLVTIPIHLATAEVIAILGTVHAPLSPAAHMRIFIWGDLASLCLQTIGLGLTFSGARAAGPWGLLLQARAHAGQTVLFVGFLTHTVLLAAALVALAITYGRARADKMDHLNKLPGYKTFRGGRSPAVVISPRCKLFLAVLPLAGASVLVRCAYRTAAAWGGLGSPIATDPLLWLVSEGALLTEAMLSLAVFHPALCLDAATAAGHGEEGSRRRRNTQDLEAGQPAIMKMDKRFSVGTTTLTMAECSPSKAMVQHGRHGSLSEGSQLMSSSHLMARSDAGSSDTHGSRRGSAAVLDLDPYYRYEDPFANPHEVFEEEDVSPYDLHFSKDMTSESRGLSSMEEEAERNRRLETESFVQPPRKSSKRVSRALTPSEAPVVLSPAPAEDEEDHHHHHGLDIQEDAESFVMMMPSPPRKSSKRKSVARGLSVRTDGEGDDDRLEVASVVLPSRKPSKMSTRRGGEDLDAVSLYSQ